jgi:nitrite reductase/ring-hydroxylating ferredoxin subunit/uncharacterized membrane protein
VKNMLPFKAIDRLESLEALDGPASGLQRAVHAVLRPGWLKDLLHGVPQGHPLHPVVVQLPIGTWLSAAVLDFFPGTERAAKVLVAAGLAAVPSAAASGLTDFSELHQRQARVGLVHSSANVLGTVVFAASLVQRSRGNLQSGKWLGRAGLLLVLAGGSLGGHLAYHQAAGANHAEWAPHRIPSGWQPVGGLDEFTPGGLARRMVGDVPVLVWRPEAGNGVFALADTCSHLAGPLHEGKVAGPAGQECVQCPWHGSTFLLRTGEVVRGPAVVSQPRLQTRVEDGQVQVRV